MSLKSKFNNWRWKETSTGYRFDKVIFNTAMLLIIIYIFIIAWSYDFDFKPQIYIKCDEMQPCENPFYISTTPKANGLMPMKYKQKCTFDWCKEEYLQPGFEFGEKPTQLFNSGLWVTAILFLLSFVVNHLVHNRNKINWKGLGE